MDDEPDSETEHALKCIATTGDSYCRPYETRGFAHTAEGTRLHASQNNFFRQAQFSSDGTTVVTQNEDHNLRCFVLPVDLLDEVTQPHSLSAYCTVSSPTALQSYALYPYFELGDPSKAVALSASRDLPIMLKSVLFPDDVRATYRLFDPLNEKYITPSSMVWSRDGTRFTAGSKGQISIFDAFNNGSIPIATHKSALGRRGGRQHTPSDSQTCTGLISALNISSDGVLVAGSLERDVALYSGIGEFATAFSVANGMNGAHMKGTGVTQLDWSPNGQYLLVAERQSDGIHVYDIRNTFNKVAWLSGRKAYTPQKLGMDIRTTTSGYELWAGGTDGSVRVWRNPGSTEGEQEPDDVLKMHDDAVSSTIWHPQGAVLATCSGTRKFEQVLNAMPDNDSSDSSTDDDSDRSDNETTSAACPDNRLKIWSV